MIGFLCIDKNEGMTSRLVVNKILGPIRPEKVGHAGTLDPLATGVLVVAVGRATKLVPYVQAMPKQYVATFEFGKTSDTEDITGNVTAHEVASIPSREAVEQACEKLVGNIMQRPPAYSALRVKGKRAYDMARNGEQVELNERPIVIHSIVILDYEYPRLKIDVKCGSGTYVRSLGRDVGEELGCGALMSALTRTAIGEFRLKDAKQVSELTTVEAIENHLRSLNCGVAALPHIEVDTAQTKLISHGTRLTLPGVEDEVAAFSGDGTLVGVLEKTPAGTHRVAVNFIAE